MDAAALSGVLSYWSLTSHSFEWRTIFSATASLVLLLEAFLFRRRAQRLILLSIALLPLLIPASSTHLRPHLPIKVIIFVSYFCAELLVGLLILGAVVTLLVLRPLRRRTEHRRAVTPIRQSYAKRVPQPTATAAPVAPASRATSASRTVPTSVPRVGPAARGEHPLVRTVTATTAGPARRRTVLTRSHRLASQLYNEAQSRKAAVSENGLLAARATRSARERAGAIAEANAAAEEARDELRAAIDVLRVAHEEAEAAVAARDARVRAVRADAAKSADDVAADADITANLTADGTANTGVDGPETFDGDTEHMFTLARDAQKRETEALARVTATRAVLRDVELWAQRVAADES